MTNAEAIRAKVGYPLAEASFNLALISRGLQPADIYTGSSRAFDLAYADCLRVLLSSPDSISEGGYKIVITNKEVLSKIADSILGKRSGPAARFVQRW